MQLDLKDQAEQDLAQWGLWAHIHYLPTGYTQQPYYVAPRGGDVQSGVLLDLLGNPLTITDAYGFRLDSIVSHMQAYSPQHPEIARLRYISRFTLRDIATHTGLTKSKAENVVGEIISFMAGFLAMAA